MARVYMPLHRFLQPSQCDLRERRHDYAEVVLAVCPWDSRHRRASGSTEFDRERDHALGAPHSQGGVRDVWPRLCPIARETPLVAAVFQMRESHRGLEN